MHLEYRICLTLLAIAATALLAPFVCWLCRPRSNCDKCGGLHTINEWIRCHPWPKPTPKVQPDTFVYRDHGRTGMIWMGALRGDTVFDTAMEARHRRFEERWCMTPEQREQLERDKYAEWKRDCLVMDLDQLADKYYDRENCRLGVPKDPHKELAELWDRFERDRVWASDRGTVITERNFVECCDPTYPMGRYHSHSNGACTVMKLAS